MRDRFVCCRYLAVLQGRFRFLPGFIPPHQALAQVEIVGTAALGSGPFLPFLLFFPAEGFPFCGQFLKSRSSGLLGLRSGVVRHYVLPYADPLSAGVEDQAVDVAFNFHYGVIEGYFGHGASFFYPLGGGLFCFF